VTGSSIHRGSIDPYAELLRDVRGLRREQQQAREAWFHRLEIDHKERLLFELEVLLKGLACFSNPRNHPGASDLALSAQDFREQLLVAREAITRIVAVCRLLLGERDRAFVFHRYLETVLPDDSARSSLARIARTQDSPQESLFVLRHAMTNLLEVVSGVCRLPRVPFRLFFSTLTLVQREISANQFFNPLTALEFRPEFDRIANPRILELMRQVPGEQARRLVALSFLSLFRMLRYLSLVDESARESENLSGVVYLTLAVLHSDARALAAHLRKRAGAQLAESYEQEVFRVHASRIAEAYEALLAEGHRLLGIKATFGGIAANVRLELRRAFRHDFPSPGAAPDYEQVRGASTVLVGNLRPAIQNAILVLGKALGVRLDEHGVFSDASARRVLSERLRRDVWMFSQIARAFGHKATVMGESQERWAGASSLEFVREFLEYFSAMGYPLLRAADYPRIDPFLDALAALEETDLLDPQRLDHAVGEAAEFYVFLTDLFDRISHRDELKDVPFDRRGAAEALKLYLGD
jgi:hypothetical protein